MEGVLDDARFARLVETTWFARPVMVGYSLREGQRP